MSKYDLQSEKLDRIERRLLRAARVSDEEIGKIIAAPHLFDAVKTRIRAEEQTRRKSRRFFGEWRSVFAWNRQMMAGSLAVFIVLAACALAVIFKKQNSPQIVRQTIKPEIRSQTIPAENPSPIAEIKEAETNETGITATKTRAKIEQAALRTETAKKETAKLPNRERKQNLPKQPDSPKTQAQEIFYSLPVAGNWEVTGDDLKIVRAELSKSELFALGVSLPVENDFARVKTDLLVGTNGMAVAIRIVE